MRGKPRIYRALDAAALHPGQPSCTHPHIRHHGAMRARLLLLGSLVLPPATALAAEPPAANNVRVYRCVAGNGAVALQSTPCDDKHRQQVLDMQRPQDPPSRPAPASPAPPSTSAPAEREIRIVTVQPPQPLYECLSPDGERYTSDDGVGNPRWVPLWVGGHYPPARVDGSLSGSATVDSGRISIHGGRAPGHGHPRPYPGGPAVATGTWVRDACHPLPQQEVCARLHDRRWELIRRYNSALQSERQDLTREQRGIEARLARDCDTAP